MLQGKNDPAAVVAAEGVHFLRLQRPVVMTLQTAAEPEHDKRITPLTVDYSR